MVAVVIESMEADLGRSICVNIRDDGRPSNLPADLIVELYGNFGRTGPTVPAYGPMPRGILGLTRQVIDMQELALERSYRTTSTLRVSSRSGPTARMK